MQRKSPDSRLFLHQLNVKSSYEEGQTAFLVSSFERQTF